MVHLAYLSGSLAVGLGHGASDLDLYLVGDEHCARLARTDVRDDGTVVQVNTVPRTRADHLLEIARRFTVTPENRGQVRLDDETLGALIRLTVGEMLYVSDDYADRYALLDRDVVRKIVMATHARLCAAHTEDAVGGVRAADWRLAVKSAALLVAAGAECLLAATDDLYVPAKPFLHKRLARAFRDQTIEHQVWDATLRAPPLYASASQVRGHVLRALELGNSLCAQALTDGWDRPITSVRDPVTAGDGPRRNPSFTVMRFSDGIGLSTHGRAFRVTEPLLKVWSFLDGAPVEEAYAALRTYYPEFATYDDANLDSAVRRLIETGAALPSPSPTDPRGGDFHARV